MVLDQGIKIVEMKCQGCGSALKIPDGNTKIVQCEYCGNTYAIESPYKVPDWQPLPPERDSQSSLFRYHMVFPRGIYSGDCGDSVWLCLVSECAGKWEESDFADCYK